MHCNGAVCVAGGDPARLDSVACHACQPEQEEATTKTDTKTDSDLREPACRSNEQGSRTKHRLCRVCRQTVHARLTRLDCRVSAGEPYIEYIDLSTAQPC
jgi:hypothetical protein